MLINLLLLHIEISFIKPKSIIFIFKVVISERLEINILEGFKLKWDILFYSKKHIPSKS